MRKRKKKQTNCKALIVIMLILLAAEQFFVKGGMSNEFYQVSTICILGALIGYAGIIVIRKQKYKKCGIAEIDRMSGAEFENFLKYYFSKLGYRSEVTQASNDYGADLILNKNKERIVVQAKRYSGKVGISAVQEVISANVYYGGTKPMVVTNSFFTNQAIELASKGNVELWDRNKLVSTLYRIKGKRMVSEAEKEIS